MADGDGWKRRLAAQIVGMLPESDEEALELLSMARKMVTEFGDASESRGSGVVMPFAADLTRKATND